MMNSLALIALAIDPSVKAILILLLVIVLIGVVVWVVTKHIPMTAPIPGIIIAIAVIFICYLIYITVAG